MKITPTPLAGVYTIEPKVHGDARGFFMETFNARDFEAAGLNTQWLQDNHSRSGRGVLRGLHFQIEPMAQIKLVRVTAGAVYDVVVDIRPQSPTYGQSYGVELSAENKKCLYVPQGFAHGFCVLADDTDFLYKCSNVYSPAHEGGLLWNDPALNIAWPVREPTVAERDKLWPTLAALGPAQKSQGIQKGQP